MDAREKIRSRMRSARRALAPAFVRTASALIQRAALKLAERHNAGRICCYLASPREVQTEAIIKKYRAGKKQLFVPAYRAAWRQYAPARFGPDDKIRAGKFKVREPVRPRWIRAEKIDLVFVPGLAFDRRGGRLGHGGGHYDRLLAQAALRPAFKVGLAFEFQILNRLPLRARDVRMDMVITESAVYRPRRRLAATKDGSAGRRTLPVGPSLWLGRKTSPQKWVMPAQPQARVYHAKCVARVLNRKSEVSESLNNAKYGQKQR